MKNLLIILTLGLMFGQTKVTSKMFDLNINISGDDEIVLPISDIIGLDVDKGTIQLVNVDGEVSGGVNVSYHMSEYDLNTYISYFTIGQSDEYYTVSGGGETFFFNDLIDTIKFYTYNTANYIQGVKENVWDPNY